MWLRYTHVWLINYLLFGGYAIIMMQIMSIEIVRVQSLSRSKLRHPTPWKYRDSISKYSEYNVLYKLHFTFGGNMNASCSIHT